MLGLFGRRRHERASFLLYNEAVRAGRDPYYYEALGVPDTLDGRFDMVGLHVFLLIDRLRGAPEPGPALSQGVFDAMFADMDFNLREMGVGDMSVGKRNRQMWEAFHGRANAYEAALDDDDGDEALAAALRRNVWRDAAPEGAAERLAGQVRRCRAALEREPLERFVDGTASFPAAKAAAA